MLCFKSYYIRVILVVFDSLLFRCILSHKPTELQIFPLRIKQKFPSACSSTCSVKTNPA